MGHSQRVTKLYVCMNNEHVGVLKRTQSAGLEFEYAESWLENSEAKPISLSMLLTERRYQGDVVMNFFDNLLPDNAKIRQRIQRRFNVPSDHCFDLLSFIGADCVGALQLLTELKLQPGPELSVTPLSESEVADLLQHYQDSPLGMREGSEFRISIAGAQEKTALTWRDGKWCLPHGVTPTTHIFKLPIGVIPHGGIDLSDSVENEWLCLQILSEYGFEVNKAQIATFDQQKVLVLERFDREVIDKNTMIRLPQEDMCQVLGVSPDTKYESDGGPGIQAIMEILDGSYSSKIDRETFMKAVFLFWVMGAIDGHAKNFSISIHEGGRYKLTPLYDVMSAYPLAEKRQLEWKKLKMAMSVKGKNRHYKWDEIQLRHWFDMAKLCRFPDESMQKIIDEVFGQMDEVIKRVTKIVPDDFPSDIEFAIFNGMRRMRDKHSQ